MENVTKSNLFRNESRLELFAGASYGNISSL